MQAWSAHQAMMRAYHQAGELVADAGETLREAEQVLLAVLSDQLSRSPLSAFDGLAGLTSGYGAWAAKRSVLLRNARIAGRLAANPSMSYERMWRALLRQRDHLDEAEKALRRTSTPLARAVNRVPLGLRERLAMNADVIIPEEGTGLLARGSKSVLGRVPVVGAGVTAVGIGFDAAGGKSVDKAVVSGVASFGAGAATGALLASNPVGWSVAASAVVGIGVGYGADWAWDHGVGDVAHDAWDTGSDFVSDNVGRLGDLL